MNITRRALGAAIALGFAAGIPAVEAVAASSADPCPAIDTEPVCDLAPAASQSGSDGIQVTARPDPPARASSGGGVVRFECSSAHWAVIVPCP